MYGSNKRALTFGLDFDDTVTRNPELFVEMVKLISRFGGDIYITTARDTGMWCDKLRKFTEATGVTVIFTNTKAKQDVADIDIWIDDFPLAITHDFVETGWKVSKNMEQYIKNP